MVCRTTSAAVIIIDMRTSFAIASTADVVLAYVITGDTRVDEMSDAGLYGLSNTLFQRTSIEPSFPVGIDLEVDELAFFPFIYWPVTADQQLPSREAYAKLNRYLRTGSVFLSVLLGRPGGRVRTREAVAV